MVAACAGARAGRAHRAPVSMRLGWLISRSPGCRRRTSAAAAASSSSSARPSASVSWMATVPTKSFHAGASATASAIALGAMATSAATAARRANAAAVAAAAALLRGRRMVPHCVHHARDLHAALADRRRRARRSRHTAGPAWPSAVLVPLVLFVGRGGRSGGGPASPVAAPRRPRGRARHRPRTCQRSVSPGASLAHHPPLSFPVPQRARAAHPPRLLAGGSRRVHRGRIAGTPTPSHTAIAANWPPVAPTRRRTE